MFSAVIRGSINFEHGFVKKNWRIICKNPPFLSVCCVGVSVVVLSALVGILLVLWRRKVARKQRRHFNR